MANITLELLKKDSIRVYPGMMVVYPPSFQREALNVSEMALKFNGCYSVNNSTVCYICDNEVFVTPYTTHAICSVCSSGLHQEFFYVPFSNGDYPENEKTEWSTFRKKAYQSYVDEFTKSCISYCDQNFIGTISDEALQNCFEMPFTGVRVKCGNFEDCYFPIIMPPFFDCVTTNRIGRFCANNGKIVFSYRNGKTYVAKGFGISDELLAAGYTQANIFVPFSNWEEILDPVLRERWESIKRFS